MAAGVLAVTVIGMSTALVPGASPHPDTAHRVMQAEAAIMAAAVAITAGMVTTAAGDIMAAPMEEDTDTAGVDGAWESDSGLATPMAMDTDILTGMATVGMAILMGTGILVTATPMDMVTATLR